MTKTTKKEKEILTNKQAKIELKNLLKTKEWLNKCNDWQGNPTYLYNGEEQEPFQVPFLIINKLEDKQFVGHLEHEYIEWASEAGDYQSGVEELISMLS